MGSFPLFIDISGKTVLIVGGGEVACRKVEALLPFGAKLYVVAPVILSALREKEGITVIERPFCIEDLEPKPVFVIAATDRHAVNSRVAQACRERGIPVNVVDDEAACDFLFPSMIQRGDLTIAVSTNGASPTAAGFWRKKIEALLPGNTEALLSYLRHSRTRIKGTHPEGKHRSALIRKVAEAALKKGAPLTAEEESEIFQEG